MDTLFYRIYTFISANKITSITGCFVLILSLVFLASKVQFEEDITKLIPINSENTNFQKVLKTTNFADKIIVNINRAPEGSLDDLTLYASQFIDSISASSSSYIKNIQGRYNDEDLLQTLDFVHTHLPLFLDPSDYTLIQGKIQKDSIKNTTLNNYKTLISPSGIVAKKTILKDPLGLSFIALKKLQQLSVGDTFTLHNGFLISKDKQHLLLFITPVLAANETSENAKFVEDLYRVNALLNSTFKGKVESAYFGSTLIAVANAKQIKSDIQLTVGIALSILLLILILFYKKISIPLILFIPTLFGGLLAVAVLYLIRTKISAISLGIGSVLLGITLDYSLHILTHIRDNNNIKNLYKDITKPILMSSLTTALAFLCLLFLDSQALQDLGLFASISVTGASFLALLFIPLVYKKTAVKRKQKTLIDTIAAYPLHQKKWIIISLIAFFIMSCFTYNHVGFNKDLSALNFEPQHLKDAQIQLDKLTNSASKSIYISTYGETEEEALKANETVLNKLISLKESNDIISFNSIGFLIHSKEIQQQKITEWNAFWSSKTIEDTKNHLIESGTSLGFKPETFKAFYALLNTSFKPLNTEDYTQLKTIPVSDFITTKNNFTTITSLVKVDDKNNQKIIDVFKDKQHTIVIDRQEMNETFLGHLKTDFNRLIGYSLVVVLIILFLFYRRFSITLVTCIPICLTWLLTIGIMGLFKIEFNIFNIIISTFIFGLGIDYSIFITNGLLHELKTGEKRVVIHKTSIILSLITTILGVGVLIFAKHPALYSISVVSIIGILSAVLISFTLQPLLFKFLIGSATNRPIKLIRFINSILSFLYFGLGGLLLSFLSVTLLKLLPISKKTKMAWFHFTVSKFMKSVLYSYPFFTKSIINSHQETFKKQSIIIANHTSFLDILAIGMLHPKIIFLVNDWVYHSPIFGKAVQLAGFYPVSSGLENGLSHLEEKINQGYSLMVFPEGTRSKTNKMKRFHKGAFYLAEHFKLDIIPVLIHGNSEILPKGKFIIQDGALSLKILNRITPEDSQYGDSYSKRTKLISRYFKSEFKKFRLEKESKNYFSKIVLDEYKYKSKTIHNTIKGDLKRYGNTYKIILNTIGAKETIAHISKDYGALDFLLNLDEEDRTITTYIENQDHLILAKNSHLTNRSKKINFVNTLEEVFKTNASVFICSLSLKSLKLNSLDASTLIFIKDAKTDLEHDNQFTNCEEIFKSDQLLILKKTIT